MSTKDQNIQYLYLVLTHGGTPTVDWEPICAALQLDKTAVTKRWSRLKQVMEEGEKPTAPNQEFLWLMIKHSSRDKPFDWEAIAQQCGSTKGACSKRYSRMKIAFERGDAPPSTPSKTAPGTPKKTPQKSTVKTEDDGEGTPTTTPKRKRTPAKKNKAVDQEEAQAEDDEDEEGAEPKRAKSTPKARAKPKPKNAFRASDQKKETEEAQTIVKGQPVDNDGDVFLDALEQVASDVDAEGEVDEVCMFIPTPLLPCAISTRQEWC
ncbi:hypothetical protein BU25DRAFT_386072 [Macroventuria anomochaeta]|uniref:Uncharacterized protein n=1 Tax=Macroventuria anomochaeta TaxID=301207 RepID=A0ACB6SA25_9PLEO|nr:uncharacterized protein BU25DRAFT_386072 [Macroventuria anomochaeta]KAF2631146.1 hypothetical protein BU25DRAFT_386072 [Macroventuria anomochaeta]